MTFIASNAVATEIPLWPGGVPGRIDDGQDEVTTNRDGICRVEHVHEPILYAYPAPPDKNTGAAIVICPGGGYGIVAVEHEGTDVAAWFNSLGVNAFVLKYRMSPYRYPIPLMDAQRAMRIVRGRASEWFIDSNRIGIMGFSAGGNLAALASTRFAEPVDAPDDTAAVSCRPDFAVLGYPVISFVDQTTAHRGSRRNLLGKDRDVAEWHRRLSPELNVTDETPPMFFFHAVDDGGVLPANSEMMARTLTAAGVDAEVFLTESGGHGFGMRRTDWCEPCTRWLVEQSVIPAPNAEPQPDHSDVPGVIVDHTPARTQNYIGSPSIVSLPDGTYLASHDFFGPRSGENRKATTRVFRSTDRGESWSHVTDIRGMFWATLFEHRGDAHLFGTDRQYGNTVIRKSSDGGTTWTEPTDESNGLLLSDGGYHCAPVPVTVHNGRIWRAMEDNRGSDRGWGAHFRAFMMSAPEDADLLNAANWTVSSRLMRDSIWLDGTFWGWLEGSAVVTPEGDIVDLLRVAVTAETEKGAIVRISSDGRTATFEPETDFVDLPGGAKKFTIRFDEQSGCYWSVVTPALAEFATKDPGTIRNVLALTRSRDLRTWEVTCVLVLHEETRKHGYQYPDWQFDGDDIIAVVRTSHDDGVGGAHSFHDANYMTFHRIVRFRELTPADSTVDPARIVLP